VSLHASRLQTGKTLKNLKIENGIKHDAWYCRYSAFKDAKLEEGLKTLKNFENQKKSKSTVDTRFLEMANLKRFD
jgi:hypothetical protein